MDLTNRLCLGENYVTMSTECLGYLIEAAHTAGWQESKGLIAIENDDELKKFLISLYIKWDSGPKTKSFTEFSTYEILNNYGVNHMEE